MQAIGTIIGININNIGNTSSIEEIKQWGSSS
jgi:hypothetical protein